MQPHASRVSSGAPSQAHQTGAENNSGIIANPTSPHDIKPLPSLPPIPTASPRSSGSPVNYPSSIKRKPLPPSALSPPSHKHRPIVSSTQRPERFIVPASSNTLNQILDSAPQQYVTVYCRDGRCDTNAMQIHQRPSFSLDDPSSYHPSDSRVHVEDRVTFEDFPAPPVVETVPTRPNVDKPPQTAEMGMGLRPSERPPPLFMDSVKSAQMLDGKKPQSPGTKLTSFFIRKPQASPGGDSAVTEISEGRSPMRSPMPSPYPQSEHGSAASGVGSYFNFGLGRSNTAGSQGSDGLQDSPRSLDRHPNYPRISPESRCNILEAELKEISVELANSIRRELDLEDLVERLQSDHAHRTAADRTSDYFSDSGTSSLRTNGTELSAKDEVDKIKRESGQQRAQLKVELSQKWQEEVSQRKALEGLLHHLEEQLSKTRHASDESAGKATRTKELERKLQEERQVKENFEAMLQALRGELEKHRSERDNLKDEVVPQLRTRVEGLEATLAESQRAPYDVTKLQQEIKYLRDENAALTSAREMERGMNRGSMQFIAEEDDNVGSQRGPRFGGLSRSNTITGGRGNRGSLHRSGSLRGTQGVDSIENAVEKLKAVEQQKDALHNTVKYLLTRQEQQKKQFVKRTRILEAELDRALNTTPAPRKGGYEREVRVLRAEINTLRKRADDALDQKWQCEKNLAGLKMDLDRNKQETASLQKILQAKGSDPDVPGLMSATLENAIVELQKERARIQESSAQIQQEERIAEQLEEYATRSEALAAQVKKQLQTNSALRMRLKNAVEAGETNQQSSAEQINELQAKLRKLEDLISAAQIQSETAVMKHEEEVRVLKASHNAQLMRAMSTSKKSNPNLLTPTIRSPRSPMFANSKKSPRLDKTSSGPGMALHEALRTEYLENKVNDLEKALADTELEISEIVGKMNEAQVNVAELQRERDEALRFTRKLETEVQSERTRYAELIKTLNEW